MKRIFFVRPAVWFCLAFALIASGQLRRFGIANDKESTFGIRTAGRLIRCGDLRYYASRRVSFFKPGGIEIDGKRYVDIRMKVADENFAQGFDVRYPYGVTEKTIVPLFGYACQIGEVRTTLQSEDGNKGEDSDDEENVQLIVTVLEKLSKESHSNQLAIPLGGSAERRQKAPGETTHAPWQHARYEMELKSIKTVDNVVVAELRTIAFDRDKGGDYRKTRPDGIKTLTVRQGQTFESPESLSVDKDGNTETLLPPTKFLVTRIVPPVPNQNIVGWITLRPLVKEWPESPSENKK